MSHRDIKGGERDMKEYVVKSAIVIAATGSTIAGIAPQIAGSIASSF